MNQTAQNLASQGRYGDTTLVHMSPQEVRGLQALARNNGTSLTINPNTGLPEAFNLGRLLPMVAGAGLTMLSGGTLSPLTVGLMTGGLGALATGSLKEGLMMGLGAAGGAGLAGSMANLAAPAATAAAPAGGALGGSGLTAMPTPVPLPPPPPPPLDFTQPLGPQVAANVAPMNTNYALTSGLPQGGLQASPVPVDLSGGNITAAQNAAITSSPTYNPAISANSQFYMQNPITSSAYQMPPQPNLVGARGMGFPTVDLSQAPPLDFDKALGPQLAGRYPDATNYSLSQLPPAPTAGSYSKQVLEGGKQAFGSMDAAGKFLEGNKMNLAMATAPAMFASPEYEGAPESNAMIRPYSLEIDNTSGIAASPVGREDERLRYRYTAGTPYRAAKGGIMALAEGGSTSQSNTTDGQEINTSPVPVTPEAMQVYQSIARIQNAAGLPQLDMTGMRQAQPSPVQRIAAQSPAPMYQARDYGVRMPSYNDSQTYRDMEKARKEGGLGGLFGRLFDGSDGYAEGGQAKYRDVRKKINRMDDPYSFAAYQSGRGLYDAAMQNFADGGLSNVPRFLSGGGDGMSDSIPATINDRQPARLADGEFVIPADVVSHLGNGSSKAGAKQLYSMMDRVRSKRTGKKKQAPAVNPKKMMPA